MPHSVNAPHADRSRPEQFNWTYATLTVIDGSRELKPTQVAFNRICFAKPPQLASAEVEIILINGDEMQRHTAIVLPHEPGATRIPIRLLPPA